MAAHHPSLEATPMYLNVGHVERIEDPSADQVAHSLRFLPPAAPFLILSASDHVFIQAMPQGGAYRVEYRAGDHKGFVNVSLEKASELFLGFRGVPESVEAATKWRRISVFNDPTFPNALWPLAVVMIAVIAVVAWELWTFFH
jgi:hypothetical protein